MAKYTHDSNGYYFLDGEFVRRSQVVDLLNAAEAMEEALEARQELDALAFDDPNPCDAKMMDEWRGRRDEWRDKWRRLGGNQGLRDDEWCSTKAAAVLAQYRAAKGGE